MKVKIVVDVISFAAPKGWLGGSISPPGYLVWNGDLPLGPPNAGNKRFFLTAELPDGEDGGEVRMEKVGEVYQTKR